MDLDLRQHLPSLVLLFGLAVVAVFFRANSDLFVPVAQDIDFAFQLMIAGTVIAILRNELGMSTFGVFGPVILSFSWVVIGPFWGFIVIAYIFIITSLARVAISDLDLGTAHRVASLLVVAAIGLFVIEAAGQLQDLSSLQAIILFPVVLTTWYAERFVGSLTETGWPPATRRLAATIISIAAAFFIITSEPLVGFVIRSPELWVALVAINIFLGTATDTRLGEYLRFRTLRRSLGAENAGNILTMRIRNREFISKYNPTSVMAAFNKGKMKKTLHGLSIPTPATYLIAEDESDFQELQTFLETQGKFAIKPIDGSGGRDVLAVRGRDEETNEFLTNRGRLTADEIVAHTRNICVGGVSDYGARREALVEGFITPDGLLADRTTGGVPDLRVITLLGFPVMSMVRLPTEESNGTANIHTGAVAVAIDIATGEASGGYQQTHNEFIDSHPDSGADLEFSIPDWEDVLTMASQAAISSGLGFTGVDVVFDKHDGPMVLEVNRRPGLGIQNANMDGLLHRLRYVEAHGDPDQFQSAYNRVLRSQEWAKQDWKMVEQPPAERKTPSEVEI
ncbi:sugar-transfer associated ATP-grasp domain-containing protein [Halorubrum rutilum]|uniref:Sugar-transfer associated ATP-grasp domain-containing protein n=1 Tax=Halorubrum rutilum TaxID=1364933 RepID=A0ABD6AQJ0_9EURY|nr:sugar-transfer associated ATP-grasp domain-containing protein [Halorubrum rutilum]